MAGDTENRVYHQGTVCTTGRSTILGWDWSGLRMKFAYLDHNKSIGPIANGMMELGHIPDSYDPDILFLDHDAPPFYQKLINKYTGAHIVLYPHGEPVAWSWDGIWEVNPRTVAYLISNPGSKIIMEGTGYPNPIYEIGYFISYQRDFVPVEKIETVLFAPIHPLTNGFLNSYHKRANIQAYERLLQMPVNIIVRHIDSIEANGLWRATGVEFVQGKMDNTVTQADIVVTYVSTYLSLMVAQGTPVAAFGQDYPVLDGFSEDDLRFCKSWDKYHHLFHYPYDIEDGFGALEIAAQHEATMWRRLFIGEPFTVEKLGKAINKIIGNNHA